MHEELLPSVAELEKAVEANDAPATIVVLRRLANEPIPRTIGLEVYDRLRRLTVRLHQLLFDAMTPMDYGRLVVDTKWMESTDAWWALRRRPEPPSAESLWLLADYIGLPCAPMNAMLHANLADAEDPAIDAFLIEAVDRLAPELAKMRTDGLARMNGPPAFRFERPPEDDGGLYACVLLVADRNTRAAREAVQRWQTELPWGPNRGGPHPLVRSAGGERAAEGLPLLRAALAVHRVPSSARATLWTTIAEVDPTEALIGVLEDLQHATNDEDRGTFVGLFGSVMGAANCSKVAFDRARVLAKVESMDFTGWSQIARGWFGVMLSHLGPLKRPNRVSSPFYRLLIHIGSAWDFIRSDPMSPLVPFTVLPVGGYFGGLLLDALIGPPPEQSSSARLLLLAACVWAFFLTWPSLPRWRRGDFVALTIFAGVVFYGLLLASLVVAVASRLFAAGDATP